MSTLLDSARLVVASVDGRGCVHEANEAWRRVLGWEPSLLAGRHFTTLVHPDDLPRTQAFVQRCWSGEHVDDFENRVLHADGSHRWLAWTLLGPTHRLLTGFGRDVTAAKAQAAELKRVREQLRSVLDTASVYILELTPDGVIRYTNRAHPGLSREQVIGTHVLNWMPPDARPQMQEAIDAVLGGERRVEIVTQGTSDDGGTAWYRTCIGPLEIDGRIVALTLLSEDVSEQRRAQVERERERRLAALGRVSAAIAHDYNTLFTTMLCSLDATRDLADQPALLRQELSTLEMAVNGAAQLTQQLTRVSSPRADSAKDHRAAVEHCDLSAAMRELAPLLSRVAGKRVEVRFELADDPLYAALSSSDVSQVMLNLITNSREAMPDGGRVTVTLHGRHKPAGADPGDAVLRVSDTGPGIPDELVEHLFEPYFSTKSRGSGFGLATCYGIVARAGGEIRAGRAPGGGALIEMRLPLHARAAPAAASSPRVEGPGNGTLLLVDDDVALRSTLRGHLSRAGYHVLLGCDGSDALEVLHRHPGPVDLVISDLTLAGGSGMALLDTVRQERPGLRALALSGQSEDGALGWLQARGIPVLHKPFSARDLERRVRDLLG